MLAASVRNHRGYGRIQLVYLESEYAIRLFLTVGDRSLGVKGGCCGYQYDVIQETEIPIVSTCGQVRISGRAQSSKVRVPLSPMLGVPSVLIKSDTSIEDNLS
jgi:hypothetical protein